MLGERETFCTYCGALVPPVPESASGKIARFLSPPPPLVYRHAEAPRKGYALQAIYKIFFIIFGLALAVTVAINCAFYPADLHAGEKAAAMADRLASHSDARFEPASKNLSKAIDQNKLKLLATRYNTSIQEKAYYLGGAERIADTGPHVRGFDGVQPAMERLGRASSDLREKAIGCYQGAKGRIGSLLPFLKSGNSQDGQTPGPKEERS
jgi:hypothetical protein